MAEGFARIPQNILNGKERTPTHTRTCAHTNIYCISDQLCSAARLPTWSLWFLYGFPLSAVHLLPSANTHVCWTLCLCINSFTQTPPRACQVRLQSIRIHSFPIDFCSRFFFFLSQKPTFMNINAMPCAVYDLCAESCAAYSTLKGCFEKFAFTDILQPVKGTRKFHPFLSYACGAVQRVLALTRGWRIQPF